MNTTSACIRRRLSVVPVLILLFTLSIPTVLAQPDDRSQMGPAERIERMLAAIDENVGTSDEQSERLRSIFLEEAQKRLELREQFRRGDREAHRAAMEIMQAETNALVGDVLSGEQMATYLEWQESRSQGRRGSREGGTRSRGGNGG